MKTKVAAELAHLRAIRACGLAIQTLEAGRDEACNKYDERLRKIRESLLELEVQIERQAHKPELISTELSIAPEIARWLNNPRMGL